jgi:hypothetical protein
MVSLSLRQRISYLLLQDPSLVSFHLIQFATCARRIGRISGDCVSFRGRVAVGERLIYEAVLTTIRSQAISLLHGYVLSARRTRQHSRPDAGGFVLIIHHLEEQAIERMVGDDGVMPCYS